MRNGATIQSPPDPTPMPRATQRGVWPPGAWMHPGAVRAGRGVAVLCIALAAGSASAHAASIWCALQGEESVAYVSDIRTIELATPHALRALASRFVRVVNASKGTHAVPDGTACRRFADRGTAARALAAYEVKAGTQGLRLEFVGVY